MKYSLIFAPRALKDFEKIKKSGDQARLKKLRTILEELQDYLKYENATPSDLSTYIFVYDYDIATESPKFTTYGVIYEIDSKALWESADYVKYFHSRLDKNLLSRLTREDANRLGTAANNYIKSAASLFSIASALMRT